MGKLIHVPLSPAGGQADTPQGARLPGIPGELLNMFFRAGSYVRRRGAQAMHGLAYSDVLAGVFAFKTIAAGSVVYDLMAVSRGVVGGTPPQFLRQIGSALVPITVNTTIPLKAFASDYWREWRTALVSNTRGFACRGNSEGDAASDTFPYGRLLHMDRDRVTDAGIAAPTACTVVGFTPGVGSGHPGGVFAACCYTFVAVNADGSETESSRSPLSASATLALDDARRWTLQVSTHVRVTKRRLYVPLSGANNVIPYLAVDVPNNTATTFDEATLESALTSFVAPTRNGLPPDVPLDCCVFDERLFVAAADGVHYTDIDSLGRPQWEAFSSSRILRIPPRGGRRFAAVRAWDRERLVMFTDSSSHVARISGVGYDIEDLSNQYGAVSASAAAVGAGGTLLYYDGANVVRSDGGPPQVISRDWVGRALSKVPAAYAERASMFYVPEEGVFLLSIPSASTSTEPDLCLAYDAGKNEWHKVGYFWTGTAHRAPTAWSYIPSGATTRLGQTPEWITAACFAAPTNRVYWLASSSLRDEGPTNVHVAILTQGLGSDGRQVAVARATVGVGARRDALSELVPTEAVLSVRLLLDGNRYTAPVSVTREGAGQYLYPRVHNLDDLAGYVQVEITADVDHLLEVFDIQAEVVPFSRDGARG